MENEELRQHQTMFRKLEYANTAIMSLYIHVTSNIQFYNLLQIRLFAKNVIFRHLA